MYENIILDYHNWCKNTHDSIFLRWLYVTFTTYFKIILLKPNWPIDLTKRQQACCDETALSGVF